MDTNCAPLVADFFYFVMRDFMLSLSDNNQADVVEVFSSDNNQADVVEVFSSTSRYLDDLLNIDNNGKSDISH